MLLLAALAAVFSNEELVYFEREAGRTPPPWTAVEVDGPALNFVDSFGAPTTPVQTIGHAIEGEMLTLKLPGGSARRLRRVRPATCWAALLKDKRKPDGAEDWHFVRDLKLHDGGGRANVSSEGAPPAVIRMRNVVWPSGTNRPSLVLYVHTPDDQDRAVSYAWADPQARRVGINLRWMQASCTIDDRGGETK